jgi:hypothetical protein
VFVRALLVAYLSLPKCPSHEHFRRVVPSSFLTLIYIDVPGTTGDYALTWVEVAVLNAGLYGFTGAALSRLLRVGRRVN